MTPDECFSQMALVLNMPEDSGYEGILENLKFLKEERVDAEARFELVEEAHLKLVEENKKLKEKNDGYEATYARQNTKLQTQIDNLKGKVRFWSDKAEVIQRDHYLLNESYNFHRRAADLYEEKLNEQIETLLSSKDEIRSINSEIKSLEKQATMKSEVSIGLLSEITKLTESPDIAKMQGKLDAYQETFLETQTRCAEVSKRKSEYEVASQFLKDGGIKAQIIKKYVPVINNRINRHLSNMDFYVNFTLDEEFNEVIKSRYRDEFSYASFSEGEKQKIDLALLFTWREIARMKCSVNTNLLILDEVFDSSLDANGTEELLKILKGLDDKTNTFVISHKGEILIDRFVNNIKFHKVSDFSKIVEND